MIGPLLIRKTHETLHAAAGARLRTVECSVDLDRSKSTVEIGETGWVWHGQRFPYIESCAERTIYHWVDETFQPVARFTTSLIKLVPTQWGPPTFEIDGIKMLPTTHLSPYEDAERKVRLIQPRGKLILDTCGGLGYFAAWCLRGQASHVLSFEKSADVIWLRNVNPWSPPTDSRLELIQGDIVKNIGALPSNSVDAILHDPPRFGIAGELYSQSFYDELSRVLKRNGKLFHYTGAPNKLSSGRDVPREVLKRLRRAGFAAELRGDGLLAQKK